MEEKYVGLRKSKEKKTLKRTPHTSAQTRFKVFDFWMLYASLQYLILVITPLVKRNSRRMPWA